jgi:hypothetical protein
MNKSLNDFIGQVKSGLANNNHYDIVIKKPKVVTSNLFNNETMQKILLFCDQTQLPGINISTTPIRHYGEAREMPYERLFDPVNLSFYVDREMKVKLFFDEWIQNIQNSYSRTFNYYKEYITDIDIITYDRGNLPQYKVTLYEAYPKTVSAIQLDYANRDVMKVAVTMQYKYWRSSLFTSATGNNRGNLLPAQFASVAKSGIQIPSVYFDDQAQFQNNVARAVSTDFSQWWSNLNT